MYLYFVLFATVRLLEVDLGTDFKSFFLANSKYICGKQPMFEKLDWMLEINLSLVYFVKYVCLLTIV